MHPSLSGEISRLREAEIRRDAERVAIRAATPADRPAVEELALLDSATPVAGDALVAEVDGELRAALPLRSGRAVADPFHDSAHVVALLELRARQLEAARNGTRGPGRFARRLLSGALPLAGRHL